MDPWNKPHFPFRCLQHVAALPTFGYIMSGFNPSWQYWAIVDRVEHGQTSTEIKNTRWLTDSHVFCMVISSLLGKLRKLPAHWQLNKDVGSVPWFFAKHPFRPIFTHLKPSWWHGSGWVEVLQNTIHKWHQVTMFMLLWGHGVWGMVIWT